MRIEHDVSFKDLTTFKVGGTAKTVLRPESQEELCAAISKIDDYVILGGGSNVLAPDDGYGGTIIIPSFAAITEKEDGTQVLITAEAGVSWDDVVRFAAERELWGIENLSGIPGTVGGAVFQNIGAYGAALSDTVVHVTAYHTKENRVHELSKDACRLGYRTSLFKEAAGEWAILSATFALSKKPAPNLGYRDLAQRFGAESPGLSEVRAAVLAIRAKKFPDLAHYGTAGSFFLNPVVSEDEAQNFKARFPDMPLFALPEGGVKIPLAWILDNVIDAKGLRIGGAFVWHEQALVIATEPGAAAHDVRALQEEIQKKVFEQTQLKIFPEVRFLS